jgi:predicted RNA binding protein YcfA (HicA-like mRNA interferase family)
MGASTYASIARVVDKRLRHLQKLESHLKDCSPAVLENALKAFGFVRVRQSGSHRTWRHLDGPKITVPIRRPVKQFYVEEAIQLCKDLMRLDEESGGGGEQ